MYLLVFNTDNASNESLKINLRFSEHGELLARTRTMYRIVVGERFGVGATSSY
jgi:hypothetical protein